MFRELLDDEGSPYFMYSSTPIATGINVSETSHDLATFLASDMSVSRRVTGAFSYDLTSRDDELIAVLSLLLLLTIEAIATTVLLHTSRGKLSNAGFSVKHFIDLIRDFHLRHLFPARRSTGRVNYGLLAVAVTFLAATFFVEVLVLIVTNPGKRPVHTSVASVGLIQPVTPQWRDVRTHVQGSVSRPCSVIKLDGVIQGETQIGTCLSSNLTGISGLDFRKVSGEAEVRIVSDLHRFGVEHMITFGDVTASYSGRGYLFPEHIVPEKGVPVRRILGERPVNSNVSTEYNAESVFLMHNLYIAYLFSSYVRKTGDESVNLGRLRNIVPKHGQQTGPSYAIIKINGKEEFMRAKSTRFTTSVTVPNVGAMAALRYAQVVMRASIALGVVGADEYDLDMGAGLVQRVPVILWTESARTANWLVVVAVLVMALLCLGGLRVTLKPGSTAELAGVYVKGLVGADMGRSPVQMAATEKKSFYFGPEGGEEEEEAEEAEGYQYGAEIEEGAEQGVEEGYSDSLDGYSDLWEDGEDGYRHGTDISDRVEERQEEEYVTTEEDWEKMGSGTCTSTSSRF